MSCFSGAAGLRLAPLGNADTGQGYPSRRVARRKSFDQALIDFVDRFNLQGPGGCPAFSALMAQYLGVIYFGLSGCSDRSGADAFMLPRPELQREDDQRDTENQCVGAQPPGEHDSSDQRRDDEEHAIGEGQ